MSSPSEQFIEENRLDIIRFLQLSRDRIVSQREDNKVKTLIEKLESLNNSQEAYNVYLEDPFSTVPPF